MTKHTPRGLSDIVSAHVDRLDLSEVKRPGTYQRPRGEGCRRRAEQFPIGKGLWSRYPLEGLIPDALLALLTQLKGPDQQPQSEAES